MGTTNTITVTGAAERKGCSRGTVQYAIAYGHITGVKTDDGLLLVKLDQKFDDWKPNPTGKRGRPRKE